MVQLGFAGLGVMGARMAGHLLRAGHRLRVWNRTPAKADGLIESGALWCDSPESLAESSDIVFLCVSRSEDVSELVGRMAQASRGGTVFIDHSTIEPHVAESLHGDIRARQLAFLDCPVTGGEKGAIDGTLTIFCGGEKEHFDTALPFLECYGKKVRHVGPPGSGQKMKMANQIAVAISVLAMSEALVYAQKAGLSVADTVDLVGSGAGGSWSFANYGPKVLSRDWTPGFAVSLQQKDLSYALASARDSGACLPGAALTHQLFAALEASGRGGDATPALFEILEQLSGGRD